MGWNVHKTSSEVAALIGSIFIKNLKSPLLQEFFSTRCDKRGCRALLKEQMQPKTMPSAPRVWTPCGRRSFRWHLCIIFVGYDACDYKHRLLASQQVGRSYTRRRKNRKKQQSDWMRAFMPHPWHRYRERRASFISRVQKNHDFFF